jgi:RNA polymerase-binding protein DksA
VTSIETGEYKKLLQAERARLLEAATFLEKESADSLVEERGEATNRGDNSHMADMATATYDRELEEGLEEGVQFTLDEIAAALVRIEDGTYGVCEVCGQPIGAERLSAIPWTRLCIDDARRLR